MDKTEAIKLYDSITNVKDEFIEEAQNPEWAGHVPGSHSSEAFLPDKTQSPLRRKGPARLRWPVLAACLLLIAGAGTFSLIHLYQRNADGGSYHSNGSNGHSDGFWGNGDHALLETHREDFTPGLSAQAENAFPGVPGVMQIYHTLSNEWFLADNLTDFSQILIDDPFYIVPGYSEGIDSASQDGAYSVYKLDENGDPQWGMGVSAPDNNIVPYTFCRLTYDIIEEDLAEIDYEDYIIAHSTRLYTVFIWARCADGEDMFVTYPARPEFVGLQNRGRYTLEEMRQILAQAYGSP